MQNNDFSLNGKAAFVAGGAGRLGRKIVSAFCKLGVNTTVADSNIIAGQEVAGSFESFEGKASFTYLDLTSEKSIADSVGSAFDQFGRLDYLVNCARIRFHIPNFPDCLSEWDSGMEVLLKGPAFLCQYAACKMEHGTGAIVNIGSTNAYFVSQESMVYHIAKAGLKHMTEYLAVALADKGIRVNSVTPGIVDLRGDGGGFLERPENWRIVEQIVPLRRGAKPQEIAKAVLFLCSADSSFITGQDIILDGGTSLLDHFYMMQKFSDKSGKEKQ